VSSLPEIGAVLSASAPSQCPLGPSFLMEEAGPAGQRHVGAGLHRFAQGAHAFPKPTLQRREREPAPFASGGSDGPPPGRDHRQPVRIGLQNTDPTLTPSEAADQLFDPGRDPWRFLHHQSVQFVHGERGGGVLVEEVLRHSFQRSRHVRSPGPGERDRTVRPVPGPDHGKSGRSRPRPFVSRLPTSNRPTNPSWRDS
jgi:hypothetical protein